MGRCTGSSRISISRCSFFRRFLSEQRPRDGFVGRARKDRCVRQHGPGPPMHTVLVGSKGIRRRKPRRPLPPAEDNGQPLRVAGAPDEYSTMTPYGAAMGMATFVVNLIRRFSGQRRRRE